LLDGVQGITGHDLAFIANAVGGIPPDKFLECFARFHGLQKGCRGHAQRFAGNESDRCQRTPVETENQIDAHHALVADGRRFDAAAFIQRDDVATAAAYREAHFRGEAVFAVDDVALLERRELPR
jgi:hypothetical protein